MLEAQGIYNQLSDKLRADLAEKAKEASKIVVYQFSIARLNPDGEQRANGKYLYPLHWALTPISFKLVDPYDGKLKTIGMVVHLKENGHQSDKLRRVVIQEPWQGTLRLDMKRAEDRDMFAYLELHPKMENGRFRDTELTPIFRKVDEVAQARVQLKTRQARIDAMYVAANMTTQETRDFACAMGWNEHEDETILRDRIVQCAEQDPEFFREFIDNKNIEFRAVIQRAMDNNIIAFIPVESKFVWVANGQPIAVLERADAGNVLERMVDWVLVSKNGMEVFSKIKGFLAEKSKASA